VTEKLKRTPRVTAKWKYHIAAMVRVLMGGPFNKARLSDSTYCRKYCESVLSRLDAFETQFATALKLLEQKISELNMDKHARDLPQNAKLANELLAACRAVGNSEFKIESGTQDSFDGLFAGIVASVTPDTRSGFIRYGQRLFYFKVASEALHPDARVRFRLRQVGDTVEAYDLQH
jgi:hypothetical protein